MTKYSYIYNKEEKKVERNISETYPDLEILDRGLKVKRKTSVIKKGLLKAYQGEAEQPIIEIEEKWWKHQDKIQELDADLSIISILTSTEIIDESGEVTPLTEDELKNNSIGLVELVNTYGLPKDTDAKTLASYISTLIENEVAGRDLVEDGDAANGVPANLWLKSYRGEITDEVRPVVEAVIPGDVIKKLIAHERDLTVRNAEESIAAIAKMNALLMAMLTGVYGTLTDDAKDTIPDAKRGLIEYAIGKWDTASTRADRQLAEEGTALIDKLFDNEVAIADIIDEVRSQG